MRLVRIEYKSAEIVRLKRASDVLTVDRGEDNLR